MENISENSLMVNQLKDLLNGGQTYVMLEDVFKQITIENCSRNVAGVPYTIWQLLRHIEISQRDIIDFSVGSDYEELNWPDDFWVKERGASNSSELERCKKQILDNRNQMKRIIEENKEILLMKIPHGSGQTLFREAMILAEHSAYHAGEIVLMLRVIGEWKS